MRPPEGFQEVLFPGGKVWVRAGEEPRLAALGADRADADFPEGGHSVPGGRGASRVAGDLWVRTYVHGGWLGGLRGDRHGSPDRAMQELVILNLCEQAGVPVVRPVAARAVRRGGSWQLQLATVHVEGAHPLHEASGLGNPESRRSLLERAGAAVRKMHEAGVCHRDLHTGNLLVDPAGRVRIVDLDRAWVRDPLPQRARIGNLVRLARGQAKREALGGPIASDTDRRSFLEGYAPHGIDLIEAPCVRRLGLQVAIHRPLWKKQASPA